MLFKCTVLLFKIVDDFIATGVFFRKFCIISGFFAPYPLFWKIFRMIVSSCKHTVCVVTSAVFVVFVDNHTTFPGMV